MKKVPSKEVRQGAYEMGQQLGEQYRIRLINWLIKPFRWFFSREYNLTRGQVLPTGNPPTNHNQKPSNQ